jgi:hypothetical protein
MKTIKLAFLPFLNCAVAMAISALAAHAVELPFDRTCSVFHDNDDHRDVYTEEYLMALAHKNELQANAGLGDTPLLETHPKS